MRTIRLVVDVICWLRDRWRRWLYRSRRTAPVLPEEVPVFAGKPMPLQRIPVRSTKADGKRQALAYARARTGNPNLEWNAARKLLNQWGREERERNRERVREMGVES